MTQSDATEQWPLIHTYTRAQALADEVLVAADQGLARDAGWRHPVVYTAAVHASMIEWSEETDQAKGIFTAQDQVGREWDVLSMAMNALRRATPGRDHLTFTMYAVPPTGKATRPARTSLVVHIGPGDTPDPVITIMEPGED